MNASALVVLVIVAVTVLAMVLVPPRGDDPRTRV